MTTAADRAAAAHARRMQTARAVACTYARPDGLSCTVTAWLGRTLFARQPGPGVAGGASVEWGDRDYLFPAAELVIGGATVEPEAGDRLTETSTGLVFEVSTPDTGEPCWRYSDAARTTIRVHCRRVQ